LSLREGPLGELRVPLTWFATVAVIVAVIAAGAILMGDRREAMRTDAYNSARGAVEEAAAPVGGVLSAPFRWVRGGVGFVGSYFFAASENRRLKKELMLAGKWRDEAIALRDENARYRAMMGVKTDPPIPMVFARAVIDARGPFSNTRLADAGSDRGVAQGNPVLGEHGLVGRIVGVTPKVSRILLLTDVESRTPVLVPRTNARAILMGDGGPNPKLAYLRTHDPLQEGDRVLTSGDGGVFPRGLPVGEVVKGLDGSLRVALDADAGPIDYVQILRFTDFAQLADEKALAPRSMPTAMTRQQSSSILGSTAAPRPGAPAATSARAPAASSATVPSVTTTTTPKPKPSAATTAAARPKPAPPKPKPRPATPPPDNDIPAPPY